MTVISELRGHSHAHKGRICQALSLVTRLVRWERFATDCELIARVEADSDIYLRRLLTECSEPDWEFDTDQMVLVRQVPVEFERCRFEIDVHHLNDDDVWKILAETRPVF